MSERLTTRTNPRSAGCEAGGRYQAASGSVTVTMNRCEIERPSLSVAVTRTSASPGTSPRTVSVSPSTDTAATDGSDEAAVSSRP